MMNDTVETQVFELQQSLDDIAGRVADQMAVVRIRMEYTLRCIREGYPDKAAAILEQDIETLRGAWLGGDAKGSA